MGKGGIELLDVVGAQFLHLAIADIGDDKVLHHCHGLGVGLGGPFVLGGLDGNPLVQHFLYRHGDDSGRHSCLTLRSWHGWPHQRA